MVSALRLERSIKPILQVEAVRLAVVFWNVEVSDVDLEALAAVFVLQLTLKLQQDRFLDLIAVIGRQHVENDFFVFLGATTDGWPAVEGSQVLGKIQQSGNVDGR